MKKFPRKYRLIIKFAAPLIALALLAAIGYHLLPASLLQQHSIHRPPVSLTAVPVRAINKSIYLVRPGTAGNPAIAPIIAEFSGYLSELYVTEGQTVKAGQPLLKIQAPAETAGDQAAQGPPNTYEQALQEFNRDQKLYEIGAIPKRQLEAATAKLQQAKAGLTTQQNTATAASATLTAPASGVVTGLPAPGRAVQAGQQLLVLGSGQEVEIVVQLNQNDLYLVHLGTPVTVEAGQQSVPGQVSRIYPQITENQIPAFLAHIALTPPPAGLLKSGMSVTVHIDTGNTATVPAVPSSAIFEDDQGQSFIYLAVNDKAIRQQITPGVISGDATEISAALPPESMIITTRINEIKDGEAITVIQ